MSKFVVCQLNMGKRIMGYSVYVSESKDFVECSPKMVKDIFSSGECIYGLKIENGQIELDTTGFHMKNLMVKTGLETYRPLKSDSEIMVNNLYCLVRIIRSKSTVSYELVSSKCGRIEVTEKKLKSMLEFTSVAGAYLDSDKLAICDGVEGAPVETTKEKLN